MATKNEITIHSSAAEYLTFIAATGNNQDSIEMRYEDENIWLTQKMMPDLFDQITDPVANTSCCHNTCPIPADTIDDLIACVSGIVDKSIPCVPAPMPIPAGDKPMLGKVGNCMVLF